MTLHNELSKLLILGAGVAGLIGVLVAKTSITTYAATEAGGAILSPGTATTPDGNTHIRGYTRKYIRTASDPRVDHGDLTVVLNLNLDKTMSGPAWGTFTWHIGNGSWEGTAEGEFNLVTGIGHYESVGHGAGDFRGLQLRETCVYSGGPEGSCTGRIIDVGGN